MTGVRIRQHKILAVLRRMNITREKNRLEIECADEQETMRVQVAVLLAEISSIAPEDPFFGLIQARLDGLAKELAETRIILQSKAVQPVGREQMTTDYSTQSV
jgi:hypothetical protein